MAEEEIRERWVSVMSTSLARGEVGGDEEACCESDILGSGSESSEATERGGSEGGEGSLGVPLGYMYEGNEW